jgi:pimeloyl-ACP methyl ester carboxylesterase
MQGSQQPANDGKAATAPFRELRYTSRDGLGLSARDYGDRTSRWLPVVCLAGLSRSSRDFHELAVHLANHHERPRRVVAFDYRGRGRSDWDRTVANYNPVTETNDVADGMAALGIARAAIVGTSRGGIVGMLLALTRPQAVTALVLNDIGPRIDNAGLARIKSYVGRTPAPDDWTDAIRIVRRLHGAHFPGFDDADWEAFARLTYRDEGGRPVADYDPALAETLAGVDLDRPGPELWEEFRALKSVPMLVLRGDRSDILSAQTVAQMKGEHPWLEAVTVADQGHPPQLRMGPLAVRIGTFVAAAEDASGAAKPAEPAFAARTPPAETPPAADGPAGAEPPAA